MYCYRAIFQHVWGLGYISKNHKTQNHLNRDWQNISTNNVLVSQVRISVRHFLKCRVWWLIPVKWIEPCCRLDFKEELLPLDCVLHCECYCREQWEKHAWVWKPQQGVRSIWSPAYPPSTLVELWNIASSNTKRTEETALQRIDQYAKTLLA